MDPNNRIHNLYNDVQNEFKSKFESIAKNSENFKGKYESVLGKLDVLFRKNCNGPIEWLEKNTEQTQQGPVLKDKSKEHELEANVRELESCIKSHDVGSQDLLMDFDTQMHNLSSGFNDEYGKCLTFKGDDQIKSCFRNLIGGNISKLDAFYNDFSTKFDNLNRKI